MQTAAGYDFIIVGGGSAGCVLAARLSELEDCRVCLIEAGGRDWHPLYHIPAGFAKMTKGIGSWGWATVPQKHLNGRCLTYTQAKVIGGGSTINAQIYTRGNALDYEEWRQLGCAGWGHEDVLPYFRKAENNDSYDNSYHGTGGPLGVSRPAAALPICDAFIEAAGTRGIPRNPDFAGEFQEGVGYYQLTQSNARRSSAATAYLRPARKRSNLDLLLNSQALRLEIDRNRATGVVIADGRDERIIRAESEVILSSGAIGSPKLLMLSGIGPAGHLRAHGLPVACDRSAVGSDLQDHLNVCAIAECTGRHSYDGYANPLWSALAGIRYLLTRRGPVASSLFETGGFWHVAEAERSPDTQFHLGLGTGIESGIARMEKDGITLNSAYLRPRSRGTVRLASADPLAAPRIDPNYWSDPHDRDMAVRGLKLAQKILAADPLAPFIDREVLPGADVRTDADFLSYAASMAKTDHHPAGTCRMGSDADAVVTPELRCNGITGLRIADASIMPRLISSNTNAATIMIAEKAADMIKEDHSA
ncbi:MAG: FAD-dependent oxidoreductase [Rhodobacteraceae bacterium]|nr:FAD-dependent oxidoreductase [Paracoccaceae bacterium]